MTDHQPKPRNWQIDCDPFAVDLDDLQYALQEAAVILSRIGGAIVLIADREEISPDHYQTTRFRLRWTSFAPAKRIERDESPDPEPDPVGAID